MVEENQMAVETYTGIMTVERHVIYSDFLERDVILDVYHPAQIDWNNIKLLLINDGQDLHLMPFETILESLFARDRIEPLLCIGIHCGTYREQEYGTAHRADYKGRGTRAGLYRKFVLDELLPFVKGMYNIQSFTQKSFAGFSLGGLTALDIVWNMPNEFSYTGIFSGSLWWRRKGYDDGYDGDKDRLMHLQVKKGTYQPGLKFFIQTGTLDETNDRNHNGIIDSIEDATDLIVALKEKGYIDDDIRYLELQDGRHNVATWGRAFPEFLLWCWAK